jgi:O-antigen/teichoic acid export membrane protein
LKNILEEIKFFIAVYSNKSGFVRNSFTLKLGTSVAQGIPILFSPVLTRLFSPEEFGLFAIVSSITAIISVISTGKYETVILIAKNKKDAVNIIAISLIISLLVSLLAIILLFPFSGLIIRLLKQPRLEHWIFVCPIISFFISFYLVYNEWCIRESKFVHLSFNKIINSSAITLSNLLFGISRLTSGGLIFGELSGRFISAVSCVYSALTRDLIAFKQVTWNRMLILLRNYSSAPKYMLPGQLLNTIAGQASVLMLAAFFGDIEVGFYSMTLMVLTVPASLISLTIRDVFRQRANSDFKRDKNCLSIYRKTVKVTTVFSLLIFGFLFVIFPDLFSFVFGQKWRIAGEYARILCPSVMISFVGDSVWGMFIVAEKMKAVLKWQIQYLILTVFSLLIGYYLFKDIKMALICFSAGRSIAYLNSLRMTYSFSKGEPIN